MSLRRPSSARRRSRSGQPRGGTPRRGRRWAGSRGTRRPRDERRCSRRATTSARRRPTTAPRACPRRPSGCTRGSSGRRRATPRCCRTRSSSCRTRLPPRRLHRSPRPRSSAALQMNPSSERLTASRVTPLPSASVEMSQVPCRASNATAGSLALSFGPGGTLAAVRPGRNPLRHVAPVVGRHCEADVRGAALEAASDLEGRHRRPPEREAVGLHLGLVLAAVVAIRVLREPAADELAVARDDVDERRR